jgi:hypothetical protein
MNARRFIIQAPRRRGQAERCSCDNIRQCTKIGCADGWQRGDDRPLRTRACQFVGHIPAHEAETVREQQDTYNHSTRLADDQFQALVVTPDGLFFVERQWIADLALARGLPTIVPSKEMLDAGALTKVRVADASTDCT